MIELVARGGLKMNENVHNPDFNYGAFATITNQESLNIYKLSVKKWVARTNAIGFVAKAGLR